MLSIPLSKRTAFLLFRIGISIVLVIHLGFLLDWERAIRSIGLADMVSLAAGPLVWLVGLLAASVRWRLILADSNVDLPTGQAYAGYLTGAFYGVLLPGVIGGDVIRVGLCVRHTRCSISTATASVLLERLGGVLALLGMAYVTISMFLQTKLALPAPLGKPFLGGMFIVGALAVAAVPLGRRVWFRWLSETDEGHALEATARGLVQTVGGVRWRTLGMVVFLSAIFQSADIAATYLFSRAIGLQLPLAVFYVAIPLVHLATVLPISLGGLGVREGVFVILLTRFGVAASDAVTVSFLAYLNHVAIGLIGGLVQFLNTFSETSKPAPPPASGAGSGHIRKRR